MYKRQALNYVENPEDFLKKTITVRVFEVDEQENRLVLSAKEILKEKADAEKRSKIDDIKDVYKRQVPRSR